MPSEASVRRRGPRRPRAALFLCLLPLAACGAGDPIDRVLHLDPRLADGRSPTAALTEGPPPLESRFLPGEVSRWTMTVDARETALALEGPIDAGAYGHLQLVVEVRGPVQYELTWTRGGEPAGRKRGVFMPTARMQTVPIALRDAPRWTGTVDGLSLRFEGAAPRVLAARLAGSAFTPGWEPLADAAPTAGDCGLVDLGTACRRAWPTQLGVPLYTHVEVPRDAVLTVDLGKRVEGDVLFEVACERDGAFVALAERTVSGGDWLPLEVDLAAHAGDVLRLRFSARRPDDPPLGPATPVALERGEVFFGAPDVRGARAGERRPNVVLVTLDTTRGDVLGKGFTPALDALAERGALFRQAFATTNSTVPSHASIFTGLPLEEHGAIGNRYAFPVENRTLAERLRAIGYRTGAATSVELLRPGFGFGQGFDWYELPHHDGARDGAPATAAACAFVDRAAAHDVPFFLWLHLFDAHTPYGPPKAFVEAFLKEKGIERPPAHVDPPTMPIWDEPPTQLGFLAGMSNRERIVLEYHLGVAYADFLVGRLIARLEERGLLEDTLLVVTADHGESLGEHEYWFEHANLFPEVVHVPLVLAGRGVPQGAVIDARASSVDLVPTVLAAVGRPDRALEGLDLLALARGAAAPERRLWFQLSDCRQAGFRDDDAHFVATLEDGLRWIAGAEVGPDGKRVPRFTTEPKGTHHLFDLARDPDARVDVAAERPEESRRFEQEVRAWLATRAKVSGERRELTADEEQALEDLGYAGEE